jgi:hypothetical protein
MFHLFRLPVPIEVFPTGIHLVRTTGNLRSEDICPLLVIRTIVVSLRHYTPLHNIWTKSTCLYFRCQLKMSEAYKLLLHSFLLEGFIYLQPLPAAILVSMTRSGELYQDENSLLAYSSSFKSEASFFGWLTHLKSAWPHNFLFARFTSEPTLCLRF